MEKDLAKIVDPILGTVLNKHATAKKLVLTVEVNSPEWATQVKALEIPLLKTLNAALPLPIRAIEVTVRRTQ